LGVLQLRLNQCGVLAPPCIHVNLYPKGFVRNVEITCRAANPVIDQGTRIDQNFLLKDLEVAPDVVDYLLELVTTYSDQNKLN